MHAKLQINNAGLQRQGFIDLNAPQMSHAIEFRPPGKSPLILKGRWDWSAVLASGGGTKMLARLRDSFGNPVVTLDCDAEWPDLGGGSPPPPWFGFGRHDRGGVALAFPAAASGPTTWRLLRADP